MCGIVGIFGTEPVNTQIYEALVVLQHRGQDAAGIVTCDDQRMHLRKDKGLVREVFETRHMLRLKGNMGIGHVRYPTAGSASSAEAQPFYVNAPFGISLAHNGNLINAEQLMSDLYVQDRRHINTESDSEVLLNVFAHELWTALLNGALLSGNHVDGTTLVNTRAGSHEEPQYAAACTRAGDDCSEAASACRVCAAQ